MANKKLTYKEALDELENIIAKLESNEVDVDELSGHVKEATELVNYCRNKLRDTEQELNDNMA